MLAKIVQIGSSKGIRIPKAVLEQCHFSCEVSMKVDKKRLIIESVQNKAREGWREVFKSDKKPRKKSENAVYVATKFDDEWEWK